MSRYLFDHHFVMNYSTMMFLNGYVFNEQGDDVLFQELRVGVTILVPIEYIDDASKIQNSHQKRERT